MNQTNIGGGVIYSVEFRVDSLALACCRSLIERREAA